MTHFEKLSAKAKNLLGVKYPIICGAMTWISDYNLVKAVCDQGAFGVLAAGNMPPEIFEAELDKCIAGIKQPFGVNLITIAPNYRAHMEILKNKKVEFVIFAGSFPKRSDVVMMKENGKKVMAFASEESIATQMIKFGVDALILEGSEAGGHIGHVSLMILLQQVLFQFSDIPIFVGGGIATGRMIANLMLMGASGCQLGTRFVMTEECSAHSALKNFFIRAKARQAISTPQYDSKLPVVAVRALRNAATDDFGRLQLKLLQELKDNKITRETAQFEVERFWMGALRKAVVDGDIESGSAMAGQSVGLMHDILPMKTLIEGLVSDAEKELVRIKSVL
jgi:enoyl-[acyl-carrier protein] reductase II